MSSSHRIAEESTSGNPLYRHWLRRLLAVCGAGALLLGMLGNLEHDPSMHWTDALYHSMQQFALHSPHFTGHVPVTLQLSRWLAAVTTVLAGLKIIQVMLREEREAHHFRQLDKHVIICGCGRRGFALAAGLRKSGKCVIAIEKAPAADLAAACRENGVHLVTGDATKPEALQAARIETAAALITLCSDDSENCEIAAQARELRVKLASPTDPLLCRVHVGDAETRQAFQKLFEHKEVAGPVRVSFFDTFDPEARRLLVHDLPLDHDGVGVKEKRCVHLVILGFGRMGRTLAVRAAQLGKFVVESRLKISVIDREAVRHEQELKFHHPYINEICDVEFHPLEAISPATRDLLKRWCCRRDMITSVAICFDNEQRAMDLAVQIEPLLKPYDVRVAVRVSGQSGIARLLKTLRSDESVAKHLVPFGTVERFGKMGLADDENEQFVQKIHSAYVKMRREEAGSDAAKLEKLARDPAMQNWDDLPEDLRESNRQQADHIYIKLRALGLEVADASDSRAAVSEFSKDQIELLANLEHRRWFAERHMANWTFGPVKDVTLRQNPNLREWEKLTEEIKDYDRVAVEKIPLLLEGAQKKMCRQSAEGKTPRTT